jgi:hypothetical protein
VDGKITVARDSVTLPAGGAEALASYAFDYETGGGGGADFGADDLDGAFGGGFAGGGAAAARHAASSSSSVGNMHPPSSRRARVAGMYGTGAKRGKSDRWTAEDTARFYETLRAVGTDFTLVATFFPTRDRKCIVAKFRKEEHDRPRLVDAALKLSVPFDVEALREAVGVRKAVQVGVKRQAYKDINVDHHSDDSEGGEGGDGVPAKEE